MATITLKAGMVWKGAYDASATYDKLDVVRNADKTQIAVCKQGGTGIPLTNSNYWEVSIDASGIIALLEDALAHGEIYTMKIGSVTTGATSSATIVNNHQTHETILNLVLEKGEKGEKGDKGDRGEKGDTTVIDPSTATTYTLYNQTGKHTDGAMTQAAVTEEFEKLDEEYARNDGYYESMGVGMATNLKGQNTVDAEFAYRKSGGNVEVQDGNAMIEAIKGNTIAWNQLCNPTQTDRSTTISGITITDNRDGSFIIAGTATAEINYALNVNSIKLLANHVYFIAGAPVGGGATTYKLWMNTGYGGDFGYGSIFTPLAGNAYIAVRIYNGATLNNAVFKPYLIDLTLIYGSGNEPATVEQFEQDYFNWFGKPLTYEPYDAGSLRNTKVSALKTTGFNLWDEDWEQGAIGSDGQTLITSSTSFRSKNYSKILSDRSCFYKSEYPNNFISLFFYDKEKTYIDYVSIKGAGAFVPPSNACYFKISAYGVSGEYNNSICINISDPNRNGEYEPYKESTLPLDVTTLTGKLNGEGESVTIFPDGMRSAGTTHDEIFISGGKTYGIKRIGSVDLGTLNYTFASQAFYSVDLTDAKPIGENNEFPNILPNIITSRYNTVTPYNGYYNKPDKSVYICIFNGKGTVLIKDSVYSEPTTFKAAMNGVMLSYELAEPEVYVLDDFNLPKLYPVANGGTEEQLSNSPNSLPATLSIRYGLNAAAFLQNAPKNYISKESMSNFLSNLGSAMGGTWSMIWNNSTNKYDFTFTQNRSVDVEQPIEDK